MPQKKDAQPLKVVLYRATLHLSDGRTMEREWALDMDVHSPDIPWLLANLVRGAFAYGFIEQGWYTGIPTMEEIHADPDEGIRRLEAYQKYVMD